jgi:hypothetical protein
MLDLETLGTSSNSVILSIGAVKFERKGNEITESVFYERINIQNCLDTGLEIDSKTLEWWKTQDKNVYYEAIENPNRLSLKNTLLDFSKWFGKSTYIWGKGPSFDCTILSNAYKKLGLEPPWKFWNERDVRTIFDLGNIKNYQLPTDNMHHPVDDCKRQIKGVKMALKKLNL